MPTLFLKPKAPKVARPLYPNIAGAMNDIRHDMLVEGMAMKDVYEKYQPLIAKPVSPGTMRVIIQKKGLCKERKRILHAKAAELLKQANVGHARARPSVEERHGEEITRRMADTIIERQRRGTEKHYDRVERILDTAHDVIEGIQPDAKSIGDYLTLGHQYDALGRRLFNMDKQETPSPHQFNVAILVNREFVQPEAEAPAIELEREAEPMEL